MSGMVKRFAIASVRKALRIVEPLTLGSGVMLGFAAGDLVLAMLTVAGEFIKLSVEGLI